jgi:hypothetical protein
MNPYPVLIWLSVVCLMGNGCSTTAKLDSRIPAPDRSVVVLYLEAKNKDMPITTVHCRDAEHKTENQPMHFFKLGKGIACWMANVPKGSFLVSGWECTFLGDKSKITAGAGAVIEGPRRIVTIRGRSLIASTTVSEPAVYYLGSYRVDPGQAREGGHLYGTTTPTELADPPELSVLLKLAEKTKDRHWQNMVNQRIDQIRAHQKTTVGIK